MTPAQDRAAPQVGMVVVFNKGFQRWRIVSTDHDHVVVRNAGAGPRSQRYSLCSVGGWAYMTRDAEIQLPKGEPHA